MNARDGCSQLQITQNSAVTSDRLIIQNEEQKKEESHRLYSIANPTHTSRKIQTLKPYQGNVNFMHFQKVRKIIILLLNKMINYIIIRKKPIHRFKKAYKGKKTYKIFKTYKFPIFVC